jgi:hypothetical protein
MPAIEPVPDNVLIAALTEAIRSAGAGRMAREAELYRWGVRVSR